MSVSIALLPIALVILDRAEQASGRDISHRDTVQDDAPVSFPTSFADANLLLEALRDFGVYPTQTETGDIFCQIGESELCFTQQGGQPFSVEIRGAPSLEQAYRHLSNIDEDYRRCVQTAVYEKVKARAESQGLMLESEETLEDKTILLTLRIR
ncbi:hypothetical protein AGMMS50256_25180 [Betaproteobacteria bacterium]|nr:hypothetical protein AGMMS50256_25180 [Betaproteobacteria bacterium]